MPSASVKAITTSVEIQFGDHSIWTTISPTSGHHLATCDICYAKIRLTKSANSQRIVAHREACLKSLKKKADARECRSGASERQSRDTAAKRYFPYSQPGSRSSSVHSCSSRSASSHSRMHPPPSENASQPASADDGSRNCPGAEIQWTPGSVWDTYPYHQHNTRVMGWTIIGVDEERNILVVRGVKCIGRLSPHNEASACGNCLSVVSSPKLTSLRERAVDAPSHTPYQYLNAQQMQRIMQNQKTLITSLRTKISNSYRSNKSLKAQLTDFNRIIMFLSKNDIPGLRRLFSAALKRNASPRVLLNLLERAVQEFRTAKGFSDRDLDIALIVKALGGPRLLFAMQRAYGLPSDATLRRRQHIPTLLPSVGVPIASEIDANIEMFCNPDIRPSPPHPDSGKLPGNTAMFDGIALETKCSFCPKRNQILGLCREHIHHLLSTEVTSLEAIEHIRKALFAPENEASKVCLGSDATVVAIGPYARKDHYTPWPVVASSSDKTEKGEDLVKWIGEVLRRWKEHPCGEALHGPIWTLASDGDSSYRLAKYIYCVLKGEEIDPSTQEGKTLHLLEGLNLFMSVDGVTGTCDPKHIFKRFATLLRNVDGVMVNDTQVVPTDIVENLASIPGVSRDIALGLLDPSDKQNVPKAVSLIQHLNMLKEKVPPPRRAHKLHRYRVLTFMGEFLSYFMLPFIDVKMDLVDQVQSLSTFSHIAVALYLRHRTACLTGPLYADCQMVIKNIMFTIARLQGIDPNAELFIILEGTDRLEGLFGDVRTQDHARNFDIKQVSEKLSIATLLNAAFQRNPDLDRGHRRLSLLDCLGIDHVNPCSWQGNVTVGTVDLLLCWKRGRKKATEVLKQHFPEMEIPDFEALFRQKNIDILRPTAAGYVGVNNDANDKRSEVERETPVAAPVTAETGQPSKDAVSEGTEASDVTMGSNSSDPLPFHNYEFVAENPWTLYGEDHGDGDEEEDDYESLFLDSDDDEDDEDVEDGEYGDDIPIGIELEDVLSEDVADHISNNPCGTNTLKYLEVDGKRYLKSSLVATLSSKYSKKVTMRVLRARGVAAETALTGSQDRRRFDDSSLDSADTLKAGDIAGLLVKTAIDGSKEPRTIGLAVMEITGFKEGSKLHASLPSAKLRGAGTKAVGQLLQLKDTVVIGQEPGEDSGWEWTGQFLKLDTSAKDPVVTRRQLVVDVPGSLIFPLQAHAVERDHPPIANGRVVLPITWELRSETLEDTCTEAWSALSPGKAELVGNLSTLPVISNPSFPYRNRAGDVRFTVAEIPEEIANALAPTKLIATSIVSCFLCSDEGIRLRDMRAHVGGHILAAAREQTDSENLGVYVGPLPCGFCGQDDAGCLTQLQIGPRGGIKIISTCPYKYESMKYKNEVESTEDSPCTNLPIHCPLCPKSASGEPRTIWKYNAVFHLVEEHPQSLIPVRFMKELIIHVEEERRMGIQEVNTHNFRQKAGMAGSDDLELMQVDEVVQPLSSGVAPAQGRDRSGTVTQSNSSCWPNK